MPSPLPTLTAAMTRKRQAKPKMRDRLLDLLAIVGFLALATVMWYYFLMALTN